MMAQPKGSKFGSVLDQMPKDIEDAHAAACKVGSMTYQDPSTGYTVFTSASHLKR
jgi:Family of unknown function (DUF5522)